jgi:myo-inositol-1(or 4)-monophosphatase
MNKSSPLDWLEDVIRDIGSYQRNSRESTNLSSSQLKGRVDLVTEVDRESERRLVESIKNHHPDDGILAEEDLREETANNRRWIIDPLDGTTNYVQSHPFYGISVALLEDGELIHAMTYFPEMDDLFWASQGKGAFKNNSKLSVSPTNQPMNSFLATGFADLRSEDIEKRYNLKVFPDLLEKVQGIRRGGSAVHDLCLLAEGVFDGFWEFNLSSWDVAAGALIIREAGGTVTDMHGEDQWLHGRNIVASNGHLQTQLLNWIKPHLPDSFPEGLASNAE